MTLNFDLLHIQKFTGHIRINLFFVPHNFLKGRYLKKRYTYTTSTHPKLLFLAKAAVFRKRWYFRVKFSITTFQTSAPVSAINLSAAFVF